MRESVSVLDFGAVGDGATNDSGAIEYADLSTAGEIFFPRGTYLISSDLTISSSVRFEPTAKLSVPNGVVVTISGAVTASPEQQIFSLSGTGKVILSANNIVYPTWWGAAGDGSTDDAAKWAAAIGNNTLPLVVDGLGKNYRIDSTINLRSNLTIRNASFDFSAATSNDELFVGYGTDGTAITISSVSRGELSVTVSSASGLSVGDIVYIYSSDAFGDSGVESGEFARIRSISGTTVTLYGRLKDSYTTSPKLYKPALVENIVIENIYMRGGGSAKDHEGILFYLARNVRVSNIMSEFFGERHLQFQRCLECSVCGSAFNHSDPDTGLAYGITVVNGCERITISNSSFQDLRHGVAIGANYGVDRYITVTGCSITDCSDAGLDCHPQSQYVTFSGNTIGADSTQTSQDGITIQGSCVNCTGNVVMGFERAGIFLQDMGKKSVHMHGPHVIAGNIVTMANGSGTAYGIAVENRRTAKYFRVSIVGNTIDVANVSDSTGIYIAAHADSPSASIYGIVVSGNTVYAARRSLMLYASTNRLITRVSITGNTFETLDTSTYACIDIYSVTSSYIERVIITGNSIYGGKYGIKNYQAVRVKPDANMIQGFGTSATSGSFVGTNDNYTS